MLMFVLFVLLFGAVVSNACLWFAVWVSRRDARVWRQRHSQAMIEVERARIAVAESQRHIDACRHSHYGYIGSDQWPEVLEEK